MNDEEAIEELKSLSPSEKAIEIVLNLIEKQKAEIEKKDLRLNRQFKLLQKKDKEIEKKDKIIAETIEMLRYYNGMQQEQFFCLDICENKKSCDKENCYYRIKEYFENKVKEKK